MTWLIILLLCVAGFHFILLLPIQPAIGVALILTLVLWLLWKLRWIIIAIIGLEAFFGD
jgi:hypothetical protein